MSTVIGHTRSVDFGGFDTGHSDMGSSFEDTFTAPQMDDLLSVEATAPESQDVSRKVALLIGAGYMLHDVLESDRMTTPGVMGVRRSTARTIGTVGTKLTIFYADSDRVSQMGGFQLADSVNPDDNLTVDDVVRETQDETFTMYKFRTMKRNAETNDYKEMLARGEVIKDEDDPRVTRVGKWLRRRSFDEFANGLNVLAGEMVLLGGQRPIKTQESPLIYIAGVEEGQDATKLYNDHKPGLFTRAHESGDRVLDTPEGRRSFVRNMYESWRRRAMDLPQVDLLKVFAKVRSGEQAC